MFLDYRLELIIHSVLLGVLMWFVGFSKNGEEAIGGYCAINYIAVIVYTHVKYKGDPEYNFIQSTYFFAVAGEMCAAVVGGLFVAAVLESILN
jgi:hypothetical protein